MELSHKKTDENVFLPARLVRNKSSVNCKIIKARTACEKDGESVEAEEIVRSVNLQKVIMPIMPGIKTVYKANSCIP